MHKYSSWKCVDNCGACCKLEPQERVEALEALSAKDQGLFLSMVLPDGWCRHYDKARRKCSIYEQRPSFCNVKYLATIYNIKKENENEFAINCCKQQISHIYGKRSKEMKYFKRSVNA